MKTLIYLLAALHVTSVQAGYLAAIQQSIVNGRGSHAFDWVYYGFSVLLIVLGGLSLIPSFRGHSNLKTPRKTIITALGLILIGLALAIVI